MISLLLAAALTFSAEDAHFSLQTTQDFVKSCTPRDAGTASGLCAANWILDHTSMCGVNVRRDLFVAETPKGLRRMANLYAEFASDPTSRWVVVVSHFDTKPLSNCPGANDGAATSGLLISLANVLLNWKTPHGNVMLVWTDGEECQIGYGPNDGLQGSRRAVAYLLEKKRKVQGVLCVDMLGDRDLAISIPANSSPVLAKIVAHAARRIGYPKLVSPMSELVTDDHVPFLEAGMKAVDLIDFSYGPDNSWWHTSEDTCDKLSEQSFLVSGRLICEVLNLIL